MRLYLADLGHNQLTISSDVYPLGVVNLAAYLSAYLAAREPMDISIYREPQQLKAAIDAAPPDVLGLSSYSWNHNLSLSFARYVKAKRPGVLVLMGGPNFPLTEVEQEKFLRDMPEIDVAVRGPTYEGERAFLKIIERIIEAGLSLKDVQTEPVQANMWIDCRTGEFVRGPEIERIRDLDEIPSPYLAGLMDQFLETGYFPMMQISRGCPFSCSFCNSSVPSNSKVYSHSVANVKADLLYIAERVRPEVNLCFADDNFGMYPMDEEVADYIGYLQDRFGWPRYIRTTTGKNKHERIIRVMRKIRGGLPMTLAVQSMNPVVLKNINRSNIKLQAYSEIQKELLSQGMQAYGELILCLPGETKESFIQAVRSLMTTGAKRISAHQLMLLHGAPLSNPESRERFGFKTRFRVVARNIGDYLGEPVVETEEMVVETPSFSFNDYLEARIFHLLLTIFYYEGNFEEAFEYGRQEGVEPFALIERMQSLLHRAPKAFRELIREFVTESQEELFDSEQECAAWAKRNFDALLDGRKGGNLLSKYSMLGRFYLTHEALTFLQTTLGSALGEPNREPVRDQIQSVIDYLRASLLCAPFGDNLTSSMRWTTSYDVERWFRGGPLKRLGEYGFDRPRRFAMKVDPAREAMIRTRIATFGEHPSGLGKFTRTMFARDLRRTISDSALSAEALMRSQ